MKLNSIWGQVCYLKHSSIIEIILLFRRLNWNWDIIFFVDNFSSTTNTSIFPIVFLHITLMEHLQFNSHNIVVSYYLWYIYMTYYYYTILLHFPWEILYIMYFTCYQNNIFVVKRAKRKYFWLFPYVIHKQKKIFVQTNLISHKY